MEFKSLLSPSTKFAIFTATATDTTEIKIFDLLQISPLSTYCIEKDPIHKNICYVFQYIEKDKSLEDIMMPIIRQIRMMKVAAPRTIIFCQTRKQCALLYRVFSLSLGQALYSNEQLAPESRYVEMFHAGTPKSVKSHVTQQMADANSHLRVLTCTVAFGMGVDCKEIYRSIHFGPSKITGIPHSRVWSDWQRWKRLSCICIVQWIPHKSL